MTLLDDIARRIGFVRAPAPVSSAPSPRRPEHAATVRWSQGARQVPQLSTWDAEDVLAALRSHVGGTFRTSALLADWIAQSDAVSAPLQALQRSILGLPVVVGPSPLAADPALASALATPAATEWGEIMPRGVAAEVVRWCALMGFCVVERRWRLDPTDGRWTVSLRPVHPCWVRWDWGAERFIVSTATGEERVEPGLGTRYAVFVDLDASRPWMGGGVLSLGILALLAWWCDRDGARWGERHGLPPIGAKVPMSEWDSPKTDRFIADLAELGSEPIIRLPIDTQTGHGFDLEWKELANQEAWKGFLEGGRDIRTRAATVILGQPLTTQAGVSGSGSYALGRVHAQVRQDVMESYAALLSGAREHTLVPLAWLNDTPDQRAASHVAPVVTYDASPPADQLAAATASQARAVAVSAWLAAGVQVDAAAEARAAGMILRGPPKSPGAPRAKAATLAPVARAEAAQAWVDDLHTACVHAAPAALQAGALGDARKALRESMGYADLRRRVAALRGARSPELGALAEGAVLAAAAAGALSAGPGDGG